MGLTSASQILGNTFSTIAGLPVASDGDTAKDGMVHCGVCGERKQAWIEMPNDADGNAQPPMLLPVMCRCAREKYEADRAEHRRAQFKHNLTEARERFGLQARQIAGVTFAGDDRPDSPISRTCREYVEQWDDMRKNNIGVLFYGSKGTGKTFYAAAIANALADRMVYTALTSAAHLVSVMQGERYRAGVIENVNAFGLFVLDDLGTERDTAFGSETMYNVLDGRYKAHKPLIVTTNLDLADMERETDIWRSRMYDRVLEMCPITLKVDGESRRAAIAEERKNIARELLRNARRQNRGDESE